MHDVLNRQLIAPAIALALACATPHGRAEAPREATVAEQLQAARLMQAALATRAAKPDEWRKLDETYAALVAQNPRDVAVRDARAEFLWEIGEQPRALAEWEAALQFDPANRLVLEHLGSSMLALGEVRKAAGYYARAVAADPTDADGHFALANVWFLFRHELLDAAHPDAASLLAGALDHFAEASRLAPANRDYARAYAETFYSLPSPDWTAALAAWEKFRRLSPQEDFALLQLARVHLKMGHFDTASDCLKPIQDPAYQKLKSRLEEQLNAQRQTVGRLPTIAP